LPDHTEAELRKLVADAGRILFRLGLTDYMGHVSARIPGTDHIVIKPQHSVRIRAQDRVRPEDLLVLDLNGNTVVGSERPPSERFIHTSIYRARPEVQAVAHTHQPMATMMGVASAPILPILHVEAALVEQGVPIWPCAMLVTSPELGEQMVAAIGDHRVSILQGHGIVSVAATVQEATIGAVHLERLADANHKILAMGREPRVIPAEEIAQLRASGVGFEVRWAYYRELAGIED
jgi:ribulose-5-phosphate 4-epimerase/fuculose-1-phosphate aldolase